MVKPGVGELVGGGFVHVGGEVGVGRWCFAALDAASERGAFFDGECVAGDVFGGEVDGCLEAGEPVGEGLVGEAVDEVEVDALEAGVAGGAEGGGGGLG